MPPNYEDDGEDMYGEEFINIEISKPEAFELSNNLLLLKLPNFIKIDPK